MEAGKVLVVEHDPRTRERLKRGLKRRGFEVISTSSRAEAFDMLDGAGAQILVTEERHGSYRVVWLGDANRGDLEFEPTRGGWKRFDQARLGA
jgi:CheY-like chemotaxis protein